MTEYVEKGLKKAGIHVSRPVLAVLYIVFGILLFIFPALVSYIIGLFLLIQGIVLLIEYHTNKHKKKQDLSLYV